MRGRKTAANCESCMNYEYDDDYECYVCTQDLDEDEMVRFVQGDFRECPYYQVGDEYRVVRKLMRKVRKRYVAFNTNQAPPKKSLEVAVTPVGYVRQLAHI